MHYDPDKFPDRESAIEFLEEKKQEVDSTNNIFKLARGGESGSSPEGISK